ncbi:hypothetical protein DIPPA_25523 [Diplonema papillatum]|nr:hypothetical protein DIPPA_25523 [Diplonema papillatum]
MPFQVTPPGRRDALVDRMSRPWARPLWRAYLHFGVLVLQLLLVSLDGFLIVSGLLKHTNETVVHGLRCSEPSVITPRAETLSPSFAATASAVTDEGAECPSERLRSSESTAVCPRDCVVEFGLSATGEDVLRDIKIAASVGLWLTLAAHVALTAGTEPQQIGYMQLLVLFFNLLSASLYAGVAALDYTSAFAVATMFIRFENVLVSLSFWWYLAGDLLEISLVVPAGPPPDNSSISRGVVRKRSAYEPPAYYSDPPPVHIEASQVKADLSAPLLYYREPSPVREDAPSEGKVKSAAGASNPSSTNSGPVPPTIDRTSQFESRPRRTSFTHLETQLQPQYQQLQLQQHQQPQHQQLQQQHQQLQLQQHQQLQLQDQQPQPYGDLAREPINGSSKRRPSAASGPPAPPQSLNNNHSAASVESRAVGATVPLVTCAACKAPMVLPAAAADQPQHGARFVCPNCSSMTSVSPSRCSVNPPAASQFQSQSSHVSDTHWEPRHSEPNPLNTTSSLSVAACRSCGTTLKLPLSERPVLTVRCPACHETQQLRRHSQSAEGSPATTDAPPRSVGIVRCPDAVRSAAAAAAVTMSPVRVVYSPHSSPPHTNHASSLDRAETDTFGDHGSDFDWFNAPAANADNEGFSQQLSSKLQAARRRPSHFE